MVLHEQFLDAVAASKQLAQKPDNQTLLKLYSLYKQATEGDAQGEGPTNLFDMVGRAKHQAWANLAGTQKEEAQKQYIDLVHQLQGVK